MRRHKNHRIVEPNYAAELKFACLAIENAENEGWPPVPTMAIAGNYSPASKTENVIVRAIVKSSPN